MSYIRPFSPYKYLYGHSDGDYVYQSDDGNGNKAIIDYGMTNETIIEILMTLADRQNDPLLKQLAKRLADNLRITLRSTPLTHDQFVAEYLKLLEEHQTQDGEAA